MLKEERSELLNTILEFIQFDNEILCDHVAADLGIKIDYECSDLYDQVTEKFMSRSFEEIVKKTRDRIAVAIESFIEYE